MLRLIPATRRRKLRDDAGGATPRPFSPDSPGGGGGTGMRLIVPLQGVVQGGGGLVLGSLIPCALFYVLQFYLKNRSSSSSSPTSPESDSGGIQRTHSRSLLSSRSSPVAVSARAVALSKSAAASPYFVGDKRCAADPYDSIENPNGVIELGLAQNQLSLDLLQDWLSSKLKDFALTEQKGSLDISVLASYQPFDGLMELKMAMAGLMGQIMNGTVSFDPSQIVLTAGTTPAIETLSFCLADPGNAFLVPSPYYPGYDRNIRWRPGVEIIPVPCRSTDSFSLSISALERAYNQAKKKGVKVRAVLLSNPNNPVGNLLPRETLHDLLSFAAEKNIHVISDEVFAGSTHGDEEFVSVAEVLNIDEYDRSRVHIVYGLSKDLGLPGFRVGLIYSYNEHVLAAASKLARFSSVSVPTQRLLTSMLTDTRFVTEYIKINKERLRKMYRLLVDELGQLGIECVKSSGGFYCWVDMSKFMRSYSEKGEIELWNRMLNVAKIHLTPGTACHCIEPGWFRLCFTTITENDIPLVMERIKKAINSH